jgi:NAD(P)-dependent dehydrogenase (short-subunit alcohol dehydrogenase family)
VLRVLRDRGVLPRQPAELFHYLRRVGNASVHVPGSIRSNRDRAELVALRRLGTVEDCAKVVEFLATDLSDYVTGAVIPIDGGLVPG